MSKFNPHILLVMRWLQNGNLVSKEELRASYRNAVNAYHNLADKLQAENNYKALSDPPAVTAVATADVTIYANHAAEAAVAKHWLAKTKNRLNRYFELTKEDKEAYEEQARYLNLLGAKNG